MLIKSLVISILLSAAIPLYAGPNVYLYPTFDVNSNWGRFPASGFLYNKVSDSPTASSDSSYIFDNAGTTQEFLLTSLKGSLQEADAEVLLRARSTATFMDVQIEIWNTDTSTLIYSGVAATNPASTYNNYSVYIGKLRRKVLGSNPKIKVRTSCLGGGCYIEISSIQFTLYNTIYDRRIIG